MIILAWAFNPWLQILQSPSFLFKTEEAKANSPETFSSPGTIQWEAPEDVCLVTVEAWGAGGGGTNNNSGGGGGGGAYTKGEVSVTPESSYSVTIGAGGSADNNGGASSFTGDDSLTVSANGGSAGSGVNGGVGGSTVTVTGHITASYAGGAGGAGIDGGPPIRRGGGGGGGSATATATGGAGDNGDRDVQGVGGTGEATGGTGGLGNTAGTDGGAPGAGGGGEGQNNGGGTGGNGRVVLTYEACFTEIGPGDSEPSSQTIGPGHDIVDLANFTLKTTVGSDTMTAAVVTLSPAGAYENVAEVAITNTSNTNQCTSATNLTSNTVTFSSCDLAIDTTETTYKIRIKPKSHADMPPPPGASYATTGLLTGITSTYSGSGSDSGSGTITIDNLSPNNATDTSGTADDRAVTLNWTTVSGENSTTTILRWAASTAGSEVPTEGATYSAGDTISDATVACVFTNQASATSLSKIDGNDGDTGCTTSPLTNGQAYSYKIFQSDQFGNYNTGLVFTGSPFTPVLSGVHISLDTDGNVDFGAMPLDTTKTNSSSPEVISIDSGPADLSIKSTNFSHDSNTWALGSAVDDYVVKWEFSKDNSNWSTFLVADTNYSFDTNVNTDDTRNLYLRINTPTDSDSDGPYGATVTIMASSP